MFNVFTNPIPHQKDSNQSSNCKNIDINAQWKEQNIVTLLCRDVRLIRNDVCRGIAAMSLTEHHCCVDHSAKWLEITCLLCGKCPQSPVHPVHVFKCIWTQSLPINHTEDLNSRLSIKTGSGWFVFFMPLWIVYYSPLKARYCPCCRASQLDHPHRGSSPWGEEPGAHHFTPKYSL